MNEEDLDSRFGRILRNTRDITSSFEVDLGGVPDIVLQTTEEVRPFVNEIRQTLEARYVKPNGSGFPGKEKLIKLDEWVASQSDYATALQSGKVAAVDGTPLIPPQRYLAGQVYACAVGCVTAQDPLRLKAQIVSTVAPLKNAEVPDITGLSPLQRLIAQSNALLDDTSWPQAFMQYQERLFALDELDYPFVFIDGPIISENVATRKQGRELLSRMINQSNKVFIGVIKNVASNDAMYRLIARALAPGELFIVETQKDYFLRLGRLEDYSGREYGQWIEDQMDVIVRGVYRPGTKSFGFQCHARDFEAAIALMWLDRDSGVPGHEIPFLLNQVDVQLRSRYRRSDTLAAIDGLLVQQGEDYFFDEAEERNFR